VGSFKWQERGSETDIRALRGRDFYLAHTWTCDQKQGKQMMKWEGVQIRKKKKRRRNSI
jgi:hypothetical protein